MTDKKPTDAAIIKAFQRMFLRQARAAQERIDGKKKESA